MDVIHHAAIGGIGLAALAARNQEVAGLAFLVSSVLPDLDVIFMAGGKRAYLRNHQGPTHSLILSPLFAALIAVALLPIVAVDATIFLFALLGLWIHVALDLSNTFGIALAWPISKRRFCLDAVFFVDLPLWVMTLVAGALSYLLESPWTPWLYAVGFGSFILFKGALRSVVQRKLGCKLAIPSSWHPFQFFILEERGSGDRTTIYNALSGKSTAERFYEAVSDEIQSLASKSLLYQDMKAITRHFRITEVETQDGTLEIRARDLGVRNFGGKFGRTILKFNETGELVHEVADI